MQFIQSAEICISFASAFLFIFIEQESIIMLVGKVEPPWGWKEGIKSEVLEIQSLLLQVINHNGGVFGLAVTVFKVRHTVTRNNTSVSVLGSSISHLHL